MTEDIKRETLANGVRVVTEHVASVQSVAVGLFVAAGSRDEEPAERGIAHFLEHMLFKGTERRPTAKHIADEMDAVGGYLNAFTDKEYTCYYARALSEHLPVALDILTDMFVHSTFDGEETAREKKVVLEEIKRRDDDPEDLVHDLFAETIYPNHELGLPVIGSVETVSAFGPEHLRSFLAKSCGPEKLIVVGSGNVSHAQVVAMAEEALGSLAPTPPRKALSTPVATAGRKHYSRPTEQVNFCVGVRGFGQHDEDRYPLAILNNVLGSSMGARLFQEIREKRGLAYSVGSYCANHREGGYFAAFCGTSPTTYEECLELVITELAKVRASGIGADELGRAKNQFRSSIVMAQESMTSRMNRIGMNEVYFDRVVPFDEAMAKIDAVTLADVLRVAEAILPTDPAAYAIAAVGPFDAADQALLETDEDEEGDEA